MTTTAVVRDSGYDPDTPHRPQGSEFRRYIQDIPRFLTVDAARAWWNAYETQLRQDAEHVRNFEQPGGNRWPI